MKASLGESMFKPVESATAANTIFPFLSRIIIKPSDARKLAVSLRNDYSDLTEFFVYSLLGFVVPLLGSLLRSKITSNVHQEDTPYKKSKTYHITNHISQGFRIGAVINLLEVAEELPAFNGDGPKLIINAISTTSFTIWAMFRILAFKNISLNFISGRFLKTKWPGLTNLGRKITDYIIYISTVFIILNSLGVDCRAALNTLFAFGGAGTLVLSLASQDIMKQLLSGISLSLLEPFGVGDEIKTGEGELDIGTVEKIGAYNTMIRGEHISLSLSFDNCLNK
jgi:small-conductance mechanosensitive channel